MAIPFHLSSLTKPQHHYNIHVNNSNSPFPHVSLPRATATAKPLHPLQLQNLSPSDFIRHPAPPPKPLDPPPLDSTPFKLVETLDDLRYLAAKLSLADEFAVDLEHNSYRSFQGLTCLLQISTRTEDFVVDTLKLHAYMGPYLREVFQNPNKRKVMHGACNDILWLQRDFGIYVCNMFDTMQASRVLGMERNSLAYLLMYFCGISANKAYQASDWRIRPLPQDMVKYAREDTHYLLYIYDSMRKILDLKKDRLGEVYKRSYEVCMKLYEKELFTETSYLNLYGLKEACLDTKQLGIVAGLYKWREKISRADDESTGYVLPNKLLLEIANEMPITHSELIRVLKGKSHPYVEKYSYEIVEIVRSVFKAKASEEEGSFMSEVRGVRSIPYHALAPYQLVYPVCHLGLPQIVHPVSSLCYIPMY